MFGREVFTEGRVAGSETTATALSAIVWYLAHNPKTLAAVQQEVRDKFSSYADINAHSTSTLTYVHAVCLEALRIYPPLPLGPPRLVPPKGDFIDGQFVPGGVRAEHA